MAEMAKNNSKSSKAHYLYGRYLLQSVGDVAKASEEVEKARKLATNDREVLWLAAECDLTAHKYDQARDILQYGKTLYKDDPMVYLQLANIEWNAGKPKAAIAILREGLKATKQHAKIAWQLANMSLENSEVQRCSRDDRRAAHRES